MRRQFEEVAARAAEAGYADAAGLFRLTPLEIEWALTAFAAAQRRAVERMDDLAWLVGRYAAVGVNAPSRYPRRPDGVKRRTVMSEAEMKDVLLGLVR